MIQFSLNRFGKLARWSILGDRRYFVKSFLQYLVVLLLMFLFFTIVIEMNGGHYMGYRSCAIGVFAVVTVNIVLGPALMFYSMEGKHDMQTLMMLPASNFEKYMVRYIHWIFVVILSVAAFLVADVLQYTLHLVLGHTYGMYVVLVLVDMLGEFISATPASEELRRPRFLLSLFVLVVWFQSLYAVGATLFRTRKFNWIITTVFIILIGMLFYKVGDKIEAVQLNDQSDMMDYVIGLGFYLGWTIVNYWLSYRLFCRTQVISKWVNL